MLTGLFAHKNKLRKMAFRFLDLAAGTVTASRATIFNAHLN
jgi:hypothetical protein